MDTRQFELRKQEHIHHALSAENQATGLSGVEQIHLIHEALPDLDFQDISLETPCLGESLPTPFYVAGMTAGHKDAAQLNRILAQACAERGWVMGVGSQRRELEGANEVQVDEWKRLRESAPGLRLLANIGLSQLIHAEVEQLEGLVDRLGAKALVVHTNPLQEALQIEGTPHFKGAFESLVRLCSVFKKPVILKETGCGFSPSTLKRLAPIGLAAIDVSGLGGTHWGKIEGARAPEVSMQFRAAQTFGRWGESTVNSVLAAVQVIQHSEVWASGGVRSGLDAAKLIALGAHRVGFAQPALQAALGGLDSLKSWMQTQEFELKVALFCTGSIDCATLREKEGVWRTSVR